MDLIDDGPEGHPGDNAPEFTVSEISGAVKRAIEGGFSRVRVRGELGRVSRPRSGHVYLDLKDDRSVLSGVIWKGQAAKLDTQPEEGLEVIATGRLTTFAGQSKYQMVIDSLVPAGAGALMAMLEKRRKAFEAEGLFAPDRKRALPYLPEVIGVVTSPSGAVIRDILHRLRDRFPRRVLVWPVAVQGAACAPEVARAIAGFNTLSPGGALPRPDLLIVARGGGSVEDLWGFNEEVVVRAVAASTIPVISAVGHETDTTLIDFVADRRAPTPTAAAELAVPVRAELVATLDALAARLSGAQVRGLSLRRQRLRDLSRALPRAEDLTRPAAQRLDQWADRLPRALRTRLDTARLRLDGAGATLRPATLTARMRWDGQRLERAGGRLDAGLTGAISRHRLRLAQVAGRLSLRPVTQRIARAPAELDKLGARLDAALAAGMERRKRALAASDRLLDSLSYHGTLRRGYAVVRSGDAVLTSAKAARGRAPLELQFHDGRLTVGATDTTPPAKPAKRRKPPVQKTLFDE
ncbi:exodeoxyribonuclease VII large subunit [Meridianimarinicoccus sp. RP-17]|uniref:exodeoxyribonuclease VII large subunit n=1 Tax=Meridianimarinicoccus zhengii TaxID=2056810 RepID=UPI000DAE336C|nr:exodeoxyribonuclease VII large subunit [Phycocomes zhengii]